MSGIGQPQQQPEGVAGGAGGVALAVGALDEAVTGGGRVAVQRQVVEVPRLRQHRHVAVPLGVLERPEHVGVVGEQPVLAPGEMFEYTSFCPLPTTVGAMHGTYRMVTEGGQSFDAEIAPFSLAAPNAVN